MGYKIVYKVVSGGGRQYSSARIWGVCKLGYYIGGTTKPLAGCILAFDSLNNAKKFQDPHETILKCKARISKSRYIPFSPNANFGITNSMAKLRHVWSKRFTSNPEYGGWPTGTVFCTQITPIEVVK